MGALNCGGNPASWSDTLRKVSLMTTRLAKHSNKTSIASRKHTGAGNTTSLLFSLPSSKILDPLTDVVMLAEHSHPKKNSIGREPSADGEPLLEIRQLKSFHAGPISLDVARGECVAIVGESGSGKSVFLRMIADLDPCCGGKVILDGNARETWPASTWRSMVIYQPAEPAWWEPTVEAHFSREHSGLASELLPALNLKPGILQADLERLSTGERQRLALIRSLVRKPKVLLLDEPAASLDPVSTIALEALLQTNLASGMSIILVTHSDRQAERLSRRQLRMAHGQLEPM